MDRILGLPAKYIQGAGAIDRVGQAAADLADNALVFADDFLRQAFETRVSDSLMAAGVNHQWEMFAGECCRSEINKLATAARATQASIIIALGGGKALDTGKAVAAETGCPFISVPTLASTDGPVTSIAVEYSEDHTHVGVMKFNCSPATVLVDTEVIAQAPVRFLIAGMGDALSTWIEARACHATGQANFRGGAISDMAMTLARSCHDTILEYGRDAVSAASDNKVTEAVERVVEANVFLSGVGVENTGVAGAHALDAAISRSSLDHSSQHGERVALGVMFQLELEQNRDMIDRLLPFYKDVGLPTRFSEIGVVEPDLDALAQLVLREGSPIRNLPFEADEEKLLKALTALVP